jgi:alanine racemase
MVYEKNGGDSIIIRPGITMYGMWPSEDLRNKFETENFFLKSVLKWVTHVAQVKTLPAGYCIGYGLTYTTSKPTKIAVVPQGYSDGFDRGLSNKGEVLIKNSRCKVLGRVAMNMFTVDVSHLANIKAGEEVVLLGKQGDERVTAEEIAAHLGTINYEITTRIFPLLPRVVGR